MADCTLADKTGDLAAIPKIRLQPKKLLKGHINKVNSVHYAGDSRCVKLLYKPVLFYFLLI